MTQREQTEVSSTADQPPADQPRPRCPPHVRATLRRADEAIGRILADPASYTVGAAPPAGTVEGEDKADDNPAR